MNAVEQEDLPGALGQGTQGGLDTLQVVVDLHGLLRGLGQARLAHRHSGFGHAFAATFAAQVVYGQVARATQQVSVQRLDLDLGATPETQEQLLDQVEAVARQPTRRLTNASIRARWAWNTWTKRARAPALSA